ncbi:hypothetical protein ITP31_003918 [Salmonella enterica]|uniref:hypothetical protein n=1 Tax=Serratia phage PCH45 TaxID=2608368 RepID=UPI0012A813B0|nr:hypothetical protein [Salmonella enterica]QFP93050.1 hypothetical protein [Serratia phage PCH45]
MLKIQNAEVYKNSRILLGEDCHIRYNPVSPYQVIIGQNGIGKTTFLTNLLSYPSLGGKAFHKEGYSSIKFEKDGKEISVRISHDGKYSFVVDGQPENVGGTQAVQKDMFRDFLGITPEIEAVLNPNFDFLAMSPQKRQEFLAKLTTGDLAFALQLYKKLEQRARQHDGVIKRLEANLVELKTKAIPEEEYEAYKQRLEALNNDIRDLYIELNQDAQNASGGSIDRFLPRMEQLEHNLTKEWVKYYCFGGVDATDEQDAVDKLHAMRNQIASKESELEGLMQQFEMFNEVMTSLSGGDGEQDIDERLRTLNDRFNRLPPDENILDIVMDSERDYRDAHKALSRLYGELSIKLSEIQGEWSEHLLQIDLVALREEHQDIERRIYKLEQEISRIDGDLEHKHSGEVRCPDCGKQFTPGLDERRRESMIARRETLLESKSRGVAILAEKTKLGKEARTCQDQYNYIRNMCNLPILYNTFLVVDNKASLLTSPQHWLRVCSMALQTLEIKAEKAGILDDIHTLEKQKRMMAESNIESTQTLADRLAILDERIWRVNTDIQSLRDRANNYAGRLDKVRKFERWAEAQEREYVDIGEQLFASAEYELDQIRRELLVTLQASASELATLISNYEKDHTQLEYLTGMIESERAQMEAVKMSADELSPKTGMIAEQLYGFIECFLDDVMEICNNIWTYNVQIYPAKDRSAALTYVFPVEFNNSDNASDDIAKTSEGQYSLINFAIRITALRYMGYEKSMLFLDEPERAFTPVHKVKMMNFIRDMVESGLFSQVFIISHHESGWGALPYPDIIDFSYESNLPGTNEVIRFK